MAITLEQYLALLPYFRVRFYVAVGYTVTVVLLTAWYIYAFIGVEGTLTARFKKFASNNSHRLTVIVLLSVSWLMIIQSYFVFIRKEQGRVFCGIMEFIHDCAVTFTAISYLKTVRDRAAAIIEVSRFSRVTKRLELMMFVSFSVYIGVDTYVYQSFDYDRFGVYAVATAGVASLNFIVLDVIYAAVFYNFVVNASPKTPNY